MKKKSIYFLLLLLFLVMGRPLCHAQQVRLGPLHSEDSPRTEWLLPGDTICQDNNSVVYQGKPIKNTKYSVASVSELDRLTENNYEYGYGLHKGLNVSVDLSAFATFGKGLPHRGGFSQNINATYLSPLTKDGKLWIAGGGYFNSTFWGSDNYRDVGLYAMLGYRFNEHWEAYVYGQLSISNNYQRYYSSYMGYGPYGRYGMGYLPGMWAPWGARTMPLGMGMPGANVIGAGVIYNVNKSFSIGFNIEGAWYNQKGIDYFDKYNYPMPQ